MTDTVWLHIGTPKSGTSSLQKYLVDHREALGAAGLTYLTPPGKSSANDLAIAYNKRRDDLSALSTGLNRAIENCGTQTAMISSEMLYGFAPEVMFELLPALKSRKVRVLAYVRRQDRYIEAMFLQKSKNGRFRGSIDDYIAKFKGSGSDYNEMLKGWQAWDEAELVPRVMERSRLQGENVVTDALAQVGVTAPGPVAREETNVSPGYHRVQLLQAVAAAEIGDPRKIQRQLAARYPQASEDRSPILSLEARRAFVAAHSKGNEALRKTYFPKYSSLFDDAGLDAQQPGRVPNFTDAQMREIAQLLSVIKGKT